MTEPIKKTSPEVTEFAKALQEWAVEGPDRDKKQQLLRWLLSRCESRGFKGPEERDKYVTKRVDINNIPIIETVERAMAGYNPDLPASGGVRSGQVRSKAYNDIWTKAYSDIWTKAYSDIWTKAYNP